MVIISHRGNTDGPNSVIENHPNEIDNTLSSYEVEVDVRLIDNKLFLGHDTPSYEIDLKWLLDRSKCLWIHCKNIAALNFLIKFDSLNIFYHDKDEVVLTSKKYFWTYPAPIDLYKKSIAVLPENVNNWNLNNCFGVCTDFPNKF